jgi:hypothetical protein
LKESINDVASIDITNDGFTFSVERVQNEWVVPAIRAFPADFALTRARLLGLATAQIIAQKTSNPAFYPQLFLDDATHQGAQSVQVTLKAQDKVLADVLLGKAEGDKMYVRKAGEAQTYLVEHVIPFPKTAKAWLTPTLTDIDQERVKQVSLSTGVTAERQTPFDLKFTFTGELVGKSLKDPTLADSFGALFSYLQFEDVRPREELVGLPVLTTAEVTTFDGLHVVLKLVAEKGTTWAIVDAKTIPTSPRDWEAKKPATAKRPLVLLEPPVVQNEAESLNKIAKKWAFKLQEFKEVRLQSTKESLLLQKN